MKHYSRKRQKPSERSDAIPEDRISNLPEHIIVDIISFLPTKHAVATSLLSKSWRRRWTKVTAFDFDDSLGPKYTGCSLGRGNMKFVDFVNMVLMNCTAEFMNKFCLMWLNWKVGPNYFEIWVTAAIGRNVQVLDLDLSSRNECCYLDCDDFYLPDALFTCGTLEVLKLKGPIWVLVPSVVCLPKLAVLEMSLVRYNPDDKSVPKLLSGCPVLESLKIHRDCAVHYRDILRVYRVSSPVLKRLQIIFVDNMDSLVSPCRRELKIDAPALEHLVLDDTGSRRITIEGQTSANEADLNLCVNYDDEGHPEHQNMIVGVVQALNGATALRLSEKTVYDLSEASNKLSRNFERLIKLVMKFKHEWSFLMDFIDGCAQLQILDITRGHCYKRIRYWKDPICVPKCLLSSLRQFSFGGFDGADDEIAMVQYVLEHALVVESVHLSFVPTVKSKKMSRLLKKVSKLPRASPACKISCS